MSYPVVVKLSPLLVDLFPGSTRQVGLEASSVAEMIDELDRRWPGCATAFAIPGRRSVVTLIFSSTVKERSWRRRSCRALWFSS